MEEDPFRMIAYNMHKYILSYVLHLTPSKQMQSRFSFQQDKQSHTENPTGNMTLKRYSPTPGPKLGTGKRGESEKEVGNRKPKPVLFSAPILPCRVLARCEYSFLYSSHSHPNSPTANTDAFCNFTVFSFRWVIYLKCCLAALSFSSCTASEIAWADPNLPGDGRQARSSARDGARPRVRVGAEWCCVMAAWVTESRGSVEEGEDEKGSGTAGDERRSGILTSGPSWALKIVKIHCESKWFYGGKEKQ